MKNVNKIAALAGLAFVFSGFASGQVAYSVVKVPASSAYTPIAVNNQGQVLVNSGTNGTNQVSIWNRIDGAQAVDVVGTNSSGSDISATTYVVGAGMPDSSNNLQAFIWQPSTSAQWIGSLGGSLSEANGVNSSGTVVGLSYTATNYQHAFLWSAANGIQDLTPDVTNVAGATAMAINSSNQVVGYYFPNGSRYPLGFIWTQNGGLQNLGPYGTLAFANNDAGTVVGRFPVANGNSHAFSWTQAGGITDLGTLGGESSALSINNLGWIVGTSLATTGKGLLHGFLSTPTTAMRDFTTLAGLGAGEQVASAQINDLGVIAISTNKGGYVLYPKLTGTFSSSANPAQLGQAVTFTANLNSITGPPPDGETVQFTMGGKVIGTATLAGGVAHFTTSSLTAGNHGIGVTYGGDVSHVALKFAAFTQVVNK